MRDTATPLPAIMDNLSQQGFPLQDALQELLQQGEERARHIRDAQHALHTLQVSLEELEQSRASACSQVRLKEKMLTALHCDIETLHCSTIRLEAETQSVLLENLELRAAVEEQQQHRRSQLEEFRLYRSRTEAFRSAVSPQESRDHVCEELRLKMQEVCKLRDALEEMKMLIQHPDSSTIQTQEDIDFLKARIHEARQTVKERRAHLEKEKQTHTQLRSEIEIQKRRCEAILKRLRAQLKKTQASHQRLRSDVTHMQKQLEELRRLDQDQHRSPQFSARPDHHCS